MEITINKLYEGKATIIKDNKYLKTEEYTKPFIEEMSLFTKSFIIDVQSPIQLTLTDKNKDLTYNKVSIQAVLPIKNDIDHYAEVYGLVYGLDVKTPVYKIYRAYMNRNDKSLCILNPQWLNVYKIKKEEKFSYNIKALMESENNMKSKLTLMKSTFLDIDKRNTLLGTQIESSFGLCYSHDGGKVKLSSLNIIKAFQDVYINASSKYYVKETEEGTVFNYYNCFADQIMKDNKDILNKWEKTYLVKLLFKSVCKL